MWSEDSSLAVDLTCCCLVWFGFSLRAGSGVQAFGTFTVKQERTAAGLSLAKLKDFSGREKGNKCTAASMKCGILEKEGDITGAIGRAATRWVALLCAAPQAIPGRIGVSECSRLQRPDQQPGSHAAEGVMSFCI